MRHLFNAMKPLLSDLASSIVFAILLAGTDNIYLATGLGMGIGILQVLFQKVRGRKVEIMQWMSLWLVLVAGGATLYLHDPRFIIVKFSIIKVAVGVAMLKPNWMSRYLPQIVTDTLSKTELTIYSAMWPLMMFGLATANIYIGFTMSQQTWAWFLATVPVAAPWVLFALQYVMIRLHVRSIIRKRAGMLNAMAAE